MWPAGSVFLPLSLELLPCPLSTSVYAFVVIASCLRHQPIVYIHRGVGLPELAALYARADCCLVTPLIDGMNLVAAWWQVHWDVQALATRCLDMAMMTSGQGVHRHQRPQYRERGARPALNALLEAWVWHRRGAVVLSELAGAAQELVAIP